MRWVRRSWTNSNHSTWCTITAAFVCFTLIYGEFLAYILSAYQWLELDSPSIDNNQSIRFLLVSDPQILGYKNEPVFPLGTITRWDADRYLSKTFSSAVKHVQPDVIIYLGDLMDEGSIATPEFYKQYSERFYNLFSTSNDKIERLFIPGDNDIGGEGPDVVTVEKTYRFRETFHESDHIVIKFAEFARVNGPFEEENVNFFTQEVERLSISSNHKRILITHFPLLPVSRIFGKKVINVTQPDLIFSGHEHTSMHFTGERNGDFIGQELLTGNGKIWTFNTSDKLHELMVPTCSYRMGRRRMGYAAAILESNGLLHYTILWLPNRYRQLYFYMYAIYLFLIVIFVFVIKRCFSLFSCKMST